MPEHSTRPAHPAAKAPLTLRRCLLVAGVVASLAANAYLAWQLNTAADGPLFMRQSPVDRIEVIRTNGGLLQVSTIRAPETFEATRDHVLLGVPVGKTTTQIRVPATYQYHVELAPEWKITVRGKSFIVIAPRVKPTLPVAFDTARMEKLTSGTWSLLTGAAELDQLQKSITHSLAQKAVSPQLIQLQREEARKTVTEFVTKWVLEQKRWAPSAPYTVHVFFADEPIEALAAAPPPRIEEQ